jgi:threonine/homoserine/homoserine lactone efflux protein
MFETATLLLYLVGAFLLVASPGPDFLYVLSRGIAQGRRAGVLSAVGIALGLLVHTSLAALGLTVLLQTSVVAFLVVKTIGAVYLVYLGVKVLRSNSTFAPTQGEVIDSRSIIRQAMLTNVFNPKAALTFAAFLPQFASHQGNFAAQMVVLGLILCSLAFAWFSVVGACAGSLGAWLMRRPRFTNFVRLLTGAVLVGLGFRLALQRQ